jgi:hypothetical protein
LTEDENVLRGPPPYGAAFLLGAGVGGFGLWASGFGGALAAKRACYYDCCGHRLPGGRESGFWDFDYHLAGVRDF